MLNMKIYLSFDIEGISGIVDNVKDLDTNSPNFRNAMELSTNDVNAAVEGAVVAGATEIVVNDGHGWNRRNILYEKLHPKASLLRARITTSGLNMAALDESYDAVFFVGWHSRASAPGVLSHCLDSRVFTDWRVNDKSVGEPEIAASLAGTYNIPLILFTGDDASCNEVRNWSPDCELATTKFAIDRFSAICLSKEITYELIKNGAEKAIKRRKEIKPFKFEMPVKIEADIVNDHFSKAIAEIPGVELIAPLTVRYESTDYREAFKTIHVMQLIGGTAFNS